MEWQLSTGTLCHHSRAQNPALLPAELWDLTQVTQPPRVPVSCRIEIIVVVIRAE